MFRRKHSIRIIFEDWSILKDGLKVKTLPRRDEFLIFESTLPYYQVVNVIHTYNKSKIKTIIVVKEVKNSENMKLF